MEYFIMQRGEEGTQLRPLSHVQRRTAWRKQLSSFILTLQGNMGWAAVALA